MITPLEFSDLFLSEDEKINRVIFTESEAIGFSITREYPTTGLMFQPVKNQNGGVDSVALIKIYIVPSRTEANGRTPLYASISVVSKYLLGGRFRYNYEDKESPSSEDLQVWNKSLKPVDLIEIDHSFDTHNNKIYSKSNKEIDPKYYLNKLFDEHLKTAKRFTDLPFRIKVNSRDFLSTNILFLSKAIHWVCRIVFSRDINKDNRNYDTIAYELYLKPVPHNLFILKQQRELKIFGTEIPVSKYSVITTPFIFLTAYVIGYLWFPHFKSGLDHLTKDNSFVATSAIIVWFVVFDNWLPHILLSISNSIVRFANKLRGWRVRV